MDALHIGSIITTEQKRDSVHMAIAPVVAGEKLAPGEPVGLLPDGTASAEVNSVGIVDPFLRGRISRGDRFWLFLYPGSITSLRHDWSHPAFPERDGDVPRNAINKTTSETWLRDFCQKNDCPSYETVIEAYMGTLKEDDDFSYSLNADAFFFGGRDAHASIPPEFWDHIEAVTGKKAPSRPQYFSCSC